MRDIKFLCNDQRRVRAICRGNPNCPWTVHASVNKKKESWQIKTYTNLHRCNTTHENRFATATWLAKEYVETVRVTPNLSLTALSAHVMTDHQIEVSKFKASRAKKKAEQLLHGSFQAQYMMLRDYCKELLTTMPGSTVKIDLEEPTSDIDGRRFRRVYICLEPLKLGFGAGCRKLIGLDGAFIKGPYPGQLFTAVGIDSNNGMYPVAYAVVEVENFDSWKWFLELLSDDLNINNEFNWTIISDEQKGLVPAVQEVIPNVEHRFCVFHMYNNYKKQFKGERLKEFLLSAATSYNVRRFAHVMEDFQSKAKDAFDWVVGHPPEHWSRAHFRVDSKSDILYNNLCECLNGKLVSVRDKPLITLLEGIRNYLMKRIMEVRKRIDKCSGPLCPKIQSMFEKIKDDASLFICNWNGDGKYQLTGPFGEQCHCDLKAFTCSCRRWDLTGIPCKHAVAAIFKLGKNGGNGVPEDWVNKAYKLDTWRAIYSHNVSPINGPTMWEKQEQLVPILPPYHHVQPGRPRKNRRKDKDERPKSGNAEAGTSSNKLSKKGGTIHCSLCGNEGHNSKTCKGEGGERRPTVTRKLGRPRKNPIQSNLEPATHSQPASQSQPVTQPTQGSTPDGGQSSQNGRVLRNGKILFTLPSKGKGKKTAS